jgi:hypothetical protein
MNVTTWPSVAFIFPPGQMLTYKTQFHLKKVRRGCVCLDPYPRRGVVAPRLPSSSVRKFSTASAAGSCQDRFAEEMERRSLPSGLSLSAVQIWTETLMALLCHPPLSCPLQASLVRLDSSACGANAQHCYPAAPEPLGHRLTL